jgi:hypothetical protein
MSLNKGFVARNHDACVEVFTNIHDKLVEYFATKIREVADAWINSEAGIHYLSEIKKKRFG